MYSELPSGSRVEEYVGVGRVIVRTFVVRRSLMVEVITEDKTVGPIVATAVITPGEDEVILSDRALDELKISIIRPGEGLWGSRLVDFHRQRLIFRLPIVSPSSRLMPLIGLSG